MPKGNSYDQWQGQNDARNGKSRSIAYMDNKAYNEGYNSSAWFAGGSTVNGSNNTRSSREPSPSWNDGGSNYDPSSSSNDHLGSFLFLGFLGVCGFVVLVAYLVGGTDAVGKIVHPAGEIIAGIGVLFLFGLTAD